MNILMTSRPWAEGLHVANLFVECLRSHGHMVTEIPNAPDAIPNDLDLAFGWGCNRTLAHVRDKLNKPIFIFDLGMMRRTETPTQNTGYFRCGFNDDRWLNRKREGTSDRWKKLGLQLHQKRCESGHITILGQTPGDVSHGMGENVLIEWTMSLVDRIRTKCPDNEVSFRFHPLTVGLSMYNKLRPMLLNSGVVIDEDTTRIEHMNMDNKYRAMFSYCSTSAIHAILNGIPVVASHKSMFPELVSDIDGDWDLNFSPERLILQRWLNAMSYSQWTQDEIRDGTMWGELKGLVGA